VSRTGPALRAALLLLLLAGCASAPKPADTPAEPAAKPAPPPSSKGGYYKDDGPDASPPSNLASVPDAVPRAEPLHRYANRPYQALGRDYTPISASASAAYRQTGVGSWYGRRFHGQPTSSGEKYDMYAMTAAHPTLPIPSYARVTNLANGRSVVVRINDRGPFHADRIIDLSYVAAWKLGYIESGSARVQVEAVLPGAPVEVPALTTVAAPATVPEARADSPTGIYLQLGAFSARDSAENMRARIYKELGWLSDPMQVLPSGNLFRLHLGPYKSQEEARKVADRIQSELSLRPVVVSR
jgi:rare lipoprotein A